tara:strand:- start:940 stop:1158 length:219 start_codon:yes stop_codon:yes gene_type:complete
MTYNIRRGSIAWHVVNILNDNKNKTMHWREILNKLEGKKKLKGLTPSATLLSVLIRNKEIFIKPKRGWYKLK